MQTPQMSRESATGHHSARDLCEQALARTQVPVARSTMITVTAQRARRGADRSDERRRTGALRSPLDGVPIVWKDVFDVAGTVTTCGSSSLNDRPPAAADSALVRRADDLGLVTVGKTNLSEFAFSGSASTGISVRQSIRWTPAECPADPPPAPPSPSPSE